jgi:hypothetical protein
MVARADDDLSLGIRRRDPGQRGPAGRAAGRLVALRRACV